MKKELSQVIDNAADLTQLFRVLSPAQISTYCEFVDSNLPLKRSDIHQCLMN